MFELHDTCTLHAGRPCEPGRSAQRRYSNPHGHAVLSCACLRTHHGMFPLPETARSHTSRSVQNLFSKMWSVAAHTTACPSDTSTCYSQSLSAFAHST